MTPGLTSEEAKQRLTGRRAGATASVSTRSVSRIAFDHFGNPVNIALFLIASALLGLGLFTDAVLTAGLVFGNIILGVYQELRAKIRLHRIALLNQPLATVVRDGAERSVPQNDVVEGDLLLLRPGDQVQADGHIVESRGLGMDESLLTGESEIVAKRAGDFVASGAFCVSGTGTYLAERIGTSTTAAQIASRARMHRVTLTPLQREVTLVIWVMSLIAILLAVQVTKSLASNPGDISLQDSVRSAAVIATLVPQGLAVMITVSYAMAAVRLGRAGLLVQRMNAIESLSNIDVLCLDKTGTLTTNRLRVESVDNLDISAESLHEMLGDFAASTGFANHTIDAIRDHLPGTARGVVYEVPFESSRGWSALMLRGMESTGMFVLGAAEILADRCTNATELHGKISHLTRRGLRVLLFAAAPQFERQEKDIELPPSLRPLGIVTLSDEMRSNARQVVNDFAAAGLQLKILSGDNPETVAALASQAGIKSSIEPVSAQNFEQLSADEISSIVSEANVFGRLSPSSKESVIAALHRQGRYVAMIGDGVNDVPALKAVEVAISMHDASTITRNIADIVLLDNDYSHLPSAFREGQRIRNGMENIFRLFLARTLSLTLIILVASLLNQPIPVTPRHTALIAMLTVGIPSIGLAIWALPALPQKNILISTAKFVVPAGMGMAGLGLISYELYMSMAGNLNEARTALTLTSILCGFILILFVAQSSLEQDVPNNRNLDIRLAALALALFIVFVITAQSHWGREFYELDFPNGWGIAVLCCLVFTWALLLQYIWRFAHNVSWLRQNHFK